MKVRRIDLEGLIIDVISSKWDSPNNKLLVYDYEIVRLSEEMDTRDMIEEVTRHFKRYDPQ